MPRVDSLGKHDIFQMAGTLRISIWYPNMCKSTLGGAAMAHAQTTLVQHFQTCMNACIVFLKSFQLYLAPHTNMADSSPILRRLGNPSLIIHEFCTGSSPTLGRPFVDSSPIHRRLFPDPSPIMFPNLRRIFGDPSLNLRIFFTSSSLVLPR